MAIASSSEKFSSRNKLTMHDVDSDYTTAAVVTATVKDMRGYEGYAVCVMASALTGSGITLVEIVGETSQQARYESLFLRGQEASTAVGDGFETAPELP